MFYSKRRKYKYVVREEFFTSIGISADIETRFLNLDSSGCLTIRKGYSWDGPSGPTIDTKSFMIASVVHDALYQLIREGFLDKGLRLEIDILFRKLCIADGMNRFRAWYVYRSVRAFGAKSVKSDLLIAP